MCHMALFWLPVLCDVIFLSMQAYLKLTPHPHHPSLSVPLEECMTFFLWCLMVDRMCHSYISKLMHNKDSAVAVDWRHINY
jgi:Ni,Fe-hydrogenase I cytochrome b subunit